MTRKILDAKKMEWYAFIFFIVAYIVITVFHEPWFDEAQSWQIAKCASLKEMLFDIPHYEGHPPLWWLILAIPAKTGIPFEIGLKTIGFLITVSSAYLILFKLPYPRIMRLLLPFSYFVFYQYGVIVRPYGLMMLAFLLMALAFPKRGVHPWRFVGLLILLCLTSAYGIVMAGGIAICMVWELLKEKGLKRFVSELFKDRRTLALGALLVVALLLIAEIMPRSNTFSTSLKAENGFLLRLIVAMLTFIGDCMITTSSWFRYDTVILQRVDISYTELMAMCMIGALLWLMIIGASSKRHLKFFLVPYFLIAVFASTVYFGAHHMGVVLLLLLFWTGALFQDENRFEIGRTIINKVAKVSRDRKLLRQAAYGVCLVCLIIPIFWCVYSFVLEVQKEYSYGRHAAAFLEEHDLENSLIFTYWLVSDPQESEEGRDDEDDSLVNTYYMGAPVLVNAYFGHNVCMNLNRGNDREAYMHYKTASEEENAENIAAWRERGHPEILLGKAAIDQVYDDISYDDYTLVDVFQLNYIWKTKIVEGLIPVYARNDIMEEHGLQEIDDFEMRIKIEGFQITDEMREQYENGVPIEEILKPYLDAEFGPEN